MRFILPLVSLLFLFAPLSHADLKPRSTVGTSKLGIVYWHGHRILPPYRLDVEIHSSVDSTTSNVYINDLPLSLPAPPPPSFRPDLADLWAKRRVLEDKADRAGNALPRKFLDSRGVEAKANALRADKSLVDSVRVESASRTAIFWRGDKRPDYRLIMNAPAAPAANPRAHTRGPGHRILGSLQAGDMVLIGMGVTYIPHARVPHAVAEIDSIQRGLPVTTPIIRDPHIVRDLRSPRPIKQLLTEGE